MTPEQNLSKLNLTLPPAPKPIGVYKPIVIIDHLAYLSGHGPLLPDKSLITGRVPSEIDQQYAYNAAKQTALAMLATLRENLGSLNRVTRVIKLLGLVNADPTFKNHPAVINGCSDIFAQIWGPENGIGARSAVGMGSLPDNITTEIEGIFEIF